MTYTLENAISDLEKVNKPEPPKRVRKFKLKQRTKINQIKYMIDDPNLNKALENCQDWTILIAFAQIKQILEDK